MTRTEYIAFLAGEIRAFEEIKLRRDRARVMTYDQDVNCTHLKRRLEVQLNELEIELKDRARTHNGHAQGLSELAPTNQDEIAFAVDHRLKKTVTL